MKIVRIPFIKQVEEEKVQDLIETYLLEIPGVRILEYDKEFDNLYGEIYQVVKGTDAHHLQNELYEVLAHRYDFTIERDSINAYYYLNEVDLEIFLLGTHSVKTDVNGDLETILTNHPLLHKTDVATYVLHPDYKNWTMDEKISFLENDGFSKIDEKYVNDIFEEYYNVIFE